MYAGSHNAHRYLTQLSAKQLLQPLKRGAFLLPVARPAIPLQGATPFRINGEGGRGDMAVIDDKDWERQTAPLLAADLQARYGGRIEQASQQDDLFHGTDFLWCRQGRTAHLAVRVRKAAFLKYKDDFTIREDRPQSHQKTELEKIREGEWANLYAYAFSDGDRILHWSLFRMSQFNPDAPFAYMPGFGPDDRGGLPPARDTVTRIYRISGQPDGFLLKSVTQHAIPGHQEPKRTAA